MMTSPLKGRWTACLLLLAASRMAGAAPLEIGFVYASPVTAVGWVAQHESARKELEQSFGDKIKTSVVENVAVGPAASGVMRELAANHKKLIVLASFGYMNDGLKLARQFPDVAVVHASGFKQAKNFGTYNARWYEGAYIAGVAAAKTSRSGVLGVVGAMPIPDVISTINAYTLGARSVRPSSVVKVVWVNEWYNPGKERDATHALIAQGADVVLSGFQDSPAVILAAEEKNVASVAMFSDESQYGKQKLLTSITHDWTPYLRQVVSSVLNHSFTGTGYWGGLKERAIVMGAWGPAVSKDAAAQADKVAAEIKAGSLLPFAGPINDQQGKPWVPAGKALNDGDIAAMNRFVEGVVGTL